MAEYLPRESEETLITGMTDSGKPYWLVDFGGRERISPRAMVDKLMVGRGERVGDVEEFAYLKYGDMLFLCESSDKKELLEFLKTNAGKKLLGDSDNKAKTGRIDVYRSGLVHSEDQEINDLFLQDR